MAGTRSHLGVLLQYLADAAERTEGRVADGVGHTIVGAAPSAFAPHEVVLAAALHHERTLHIVLGRHLLIHVPVVEGHQAQQVVGQPHHVAVPPSAVVHVVLPVVIAKHKLVYRLRPVHYLLYQRTSQRILVGTLRPAARSHADAAHLAFVHVVGREEQVVRAVLLQYRRSPHRLLGPLHVVSRQHPLVLLPRLQVLRRESIKVRLLLVQVRERREHPVASLEHRPLRVGIPSCKHGVITLSLPLSQAHAGRR